jgi:putative membrane protein
MKKAFTLASVAIAAMALSACGSKESASADTAATENVAAADTMAMDANVADANSSAAAAIPVTGQDFANTAAASDAFEIETSKLVQSKGSSADVKKFAAEMIKAHTDSTAKIKAAAAKATPAITPVPTLTAEQQGKLDALGKLSGADLDRQYATDQVAAHEKTLAAMQAYAESGDVPSLKTAAGEIAPVVHGHLDMAKALPK